MWFFYSYDPPSARPPASELIALVVSHLLIALGTIDAAHTRNKLRILLPSPLFLFLLLLFLNLHSSLDVIFLFLLVAEDLLFDVVCLGPLGDGHCLGRGGGFSFAGSGGGGGRLLAALRIVAE